MPETVNSMLMPFSNVAHLPLAEKFEATRIAGCNALSLMPYEVEQMMAAGIPAKEVRQRADDAGTRILRLDPLNTWSRIWLPDNMDDAYIATVDTPRERVFALCAELGCQSISLNATFPLGSLPMEANATIRARALKADRSPAIELPTNTAAAPSTMPLELPAVCT